LKNEKKRKEKKRKEIKPLLGRSGVVEPPPCGYPMAEKKNKKKLWVLAHGGGSATPMGKPSKLFLEGLAFGGGRTTSKGQNP
jgi:hypothetical protein